MLMHINKVHPANTAVSVISYKINASSNNLEEEWKLVLRTGCGSQNACSARVHLTALDPNVHEYNWLSP